MSVPDEGPRSAEMRTTPNLSFAAYVHMRGLKIVRAVKFDNMRNGAIEYEFAFRDPVDQWDEFYTDFVNSEAAQFDDSVRKLKRLCKRGKGSNGRGV